MQSAIPHITIQGYTKIYGQIPCIYGGTTAKIFTSEGRNIKALHPTNNTEEKEHISQDRL